MLNRLDLVRRAAINISKNLLAFLGCLLEIFLLLSTFVYVQSKNHFQELVSEVSVIDCITIDIQIGAL